MGSRRPVGITEAVWLVILAAVAAGCSFEPTLLRASPGYDSVVHSSRRPVVQARIEAVRVTLNGAEQNTPPEFILRFQSMLDRTNLFSDLRFASGTPGATTLDLAVKQQIDLHQQVNNAKALIVAFSLLTLSPFLHGRVDYRVDLVLSVARADGQSRQYTAFAEAVGRWFWVINPAAPPQKVNAASSKALSAALASLMNRLTADEEFFAAGRRDEVGKIREE